MLQYIIYILCIAFSSSTQEVSYQFLSKGERIVLPLHKYFQNAENISINEEKSSPHYNQTLNITKFFYPISSISEKDFSVLINGVRINFNEHKYYASKSIYNQPIKLFLFDNNILIMYTYKEHCTNSNKEANFIGLNLTDQLPKTKQVVNCTSMQTQEIRNDIFLYVSCKRTYNNNSKTFIIMELQLVPDNMGYIQNFSFTESAQIIKYSITCNDIGLKYFNSLYIDSTTYPQRMYAYCREDVGISDKKIYIFYNMSNISAITYEPAVDCFINSSYISQVQNGFIVTKENKLYQFYETSREKAKCTPIIQSLHYLFATSRNYNGIYFNYFFLQNNTLLIKSSYRTNYQQLYIQEPGYKLTSYAMTQKMMGISMVNNNNETAILVYSLQDLYPRKIDTIYFNYTAYQLISVGNYLQKSFYFFIFDQSTNVFALAAYNGYELFIDVKQTSNMFPDSYYNITIDNSYQEELIVHLTIRDFNQKEIQVKPMTRSLQISTKMRNLNLSQYVMGPMPKFYSRPDSNPQINRMFINYYDQINISKYIHQNIIIEGTSYNQSLKSISINEEIKIGTPLLYLYYSSFLFTCRLQYQIKSTFTLLCNEQQNPILFKSLIINNITDTIALSHDKWLQYNTTFLQICQITGNTGQCTQLTFSNIVDDPNITNIKLIKYEQRTTGYNRIQLFVISNNQLYFGYFLKQSTKKGESFTYTNNFTITSEEIPALDYMVLTNIFFDKHYKKFLILHLYTTTMETEVNKILIYDRPLDTHSTRFIGHLIQQFSQISIYDILNVNDYILIVNQYLQIVEYLITDMYEVIKTRIYPQYGHKIVRNGVHKSDGKYVYIQVQGNNYLVYYPSMSSTNILTHKINKSGNDIMFVQSLGNYQNKYYQFSLALNGQYLHSLTIPNVVLEFTSQKLQSFNDHNCSSGNFSVTFIDSFSTLHQITFNYRYDNSAQRIQYEGNGKEHIDIEEDQNHHITGGYVHKINTSLIQGPVMTYNMSITPSNCYFVNTDPPFTDVLSNIGCLLLDDAKRYGQLLDFVNIDLRLDFSINIIVTTNNILCVQNKVIKKIVPTNVKKSCSMIEHDDIKLLMICEQGTGTVITLIDNFMECKNIQTKKIPKPLWLTYQYFKMKSFEKYLIFEIPIRYEYNKIFFISSFNESNEYEISSSYVSLVLDDEDNFLTIDYDIDCGFAYLLIEQGLLIFDIMQIQQHYKSKEDSCIEPIVQISKEEFEEEFGITQKFAYIESLEEFGTPTYSESIYLQLGTKNQAYKLKLQIDLDKQQIINQTILTTYKQYKNCNNNIKSKSKLWGQLILRICTWQAQEEYIFSNIYPISPLGSITYLQFYRLDEAHSTSEGYYPFRMESLNSNFNGNDTFQISNPPGELIASSLFNFICYYQLNTQIKWNLTLNTVHTEHENYQDCVAKVTMNNTNFIASYQIQLHDQMITPSQANWQPWIHRLFLLMMIVVFVWKVKKMRKERKLKKSHSKINLYSHEFEKKIKINSQKDLMTKIIMEKGEEY